MTDWLLPLAVGMGTGILSAWGVGGGTLLLLVMTLFLGVDPAAARGINLLYFLPTAGVGLLSSWDVIRPHVLSYLVIAAVTTFAVMFVSGHVTQFLLRRGGKEK